MAFQVTNQKTGHSFPVENTETVLDAAMRQSRAFSYSCRSGSCGSCKARLISGEVDPGDYAAGALMVTEAGGVMRSVDGSGFDLCGPSVLAAATEKLAGMVVALPPSTNHSCGVEQAACDAELLALSETVAYKNQECAEVAEKSTFNAAPLEVCRAEIEELRANFIATKARCSALDASRARARTRLVSNNAKRIVVVSSSSVANVVEATGGDVARSAWDMSAREGESSPRVSRRGGDGRLDRERQCLA